MRVDVDEARSDGQAASVDRLAAGAIRDANATDAIREYRHVADRRRRARAVVNGDLTDDDVMASHRQRRARWLHFRDVVVALAERRAVLVGFIALERAVGEAHELL